MGDDVYRTILVYRTLIPKKLINMYFYYRGSDDEPVDLGVITRRSHKAVLFGGEHPLFPAIFYISPGNDADLTHSEKWGYNW